MRDAAPSSRRLTAATVHASGAAAGASPVLRDPSDDSGVALTALIAVAEEAARADAARVLERAVLRSGAVAVRADSDPLAPAEPDELEESAVSANANGIAITAEPTPNATAKAPTRPTYRAYPTTGFTERSADMKSPSTRLPQRPIAPAP
jgi:hypothetical protein